MGAKEAGLGRATEVVKAASGVGTDCGTDLEEAVVVGKEVVVVVAARLRFLAEGLEEAKGVRCGAKNSLPVSLTSSSSEGASSESSV
jgi:hypothetical protein